jgi:hypothetical protein
MALEGKKTLREARHCLACGSAKEDVEPETVFEPEPKLERPEPLSVTTLGLHACAERP